MIIYLAGRYSRREELCAYKRQLVSLGHTVSSRWLNGNHQIDDEGLSVEAKAEERTRFALEDWFDLLAAECCIAFTEPPRGTSSRGGRHVELGAALALEQIVYVVGHRENVFCCLPQVRFHEEWESCLGAIEDRDYQKQGVTVQPSGTLLSWKVLEEWNERG